MGPHHAREIAWTRRRAVAKTLPLSKGLECVVDYPDYERFSRYRWYAHETSGGTFYAARTGAGGTLTYLHRLIARPEEGEEVDHIDGNTLDNRRSNLRVVSHRQNLQNQRSQEGRSSRYKGVYWSTEDGCWRVQIKDAGRVRTVNGIASERVAAEVYDLLAKDRFGDHARLNRRTPAPAGGWVAVEERLPERADGSVLVYCDSGGPELQHGDKCHYSAFIDGGKWFHFGGTRQTEIYNVVRWLPWSALPPPPGEEE